MSHAPSFEDLSVPRTQKVAVYEQHAGPILIQEAPVIQQKDLKPGEVLVKIKYSGVCHSDVHLHGGDWVLKSETPRIGGHEGAGYVVAIGDHTHQDNIKIGDAVGIKWLADSCLSCQACNKGDEPLCSKAVCSGFNVQGTFQQYAVSFAKHVTPIPEGVPLDAAAPILCAGVTVWKAIKNANLVPGESIVIAGAGGGLGHLAVQYASAIGLRVIALDTGDDKKALCKKLGAESFIDFATSTDLVADIRAASDGLGPHAAVVAASGSKAYEQALDYLRSGGTLVAVGLPPDSYIKTNVFFTVLRSLKIVGSYVGNREDAKQALDFAARGKVKANLVVKPLDQLSNVLDDLKKSVISGRVVLDMWK